MRLLLEQFAAHLRARRRSQKSADTDIGRLNRLVRDAIAGDLRRFKAGPVQLWLDVVVNDRTIATKTANEYMQVIRLFGDWLVMQDVLELNPMRTLKRYRVPPPIPRIVPADEVDHVLSVAAEVDRQARDLVATMIFAGLRRAEALRLARCDVASHTIMVRPKFVEAGERWDPKTDGSHRVVPINRQLREVLDERADDSAPFFPSPDDTWWHGDNWYHRVLQPLQDAWGHDWNCLDFRHTFGTAMGRIGVSDLQIAQLMGNSPAIARKHYVVPETAQLNIDFPAAPSPGDDETPRKIIPFDELRKARDAK